MIFKALVVVISVVTGKPVGVYEVRPFPSKAACEMRSAMASARIVESASRVIPGGIRLRIRCLPDGLGI